jgi:hypothetical protein
MTGHRRLDIGGYLDIDLVIRMAGLLTTRAGDPERHSEAKTRKHE